MILAMTCPAALTSDMPAYSCALPVFPERVAIGAPTAKAKRNFAAKEKAKAARKAEPRFWAKSTKKQVAV